MENKEIPESIVIHKYRFELNDNLAIAICALGFFAMIVGCSIFSK
jgi:hypothetical protein